MEAGGVRGIWGGVAAEVPRLLDPVEEMRRRATEVQRWSGKPESHRRREIVAAVELTCGETWSNSGDGAARTGASGLRVNPGLRADLWWGSAGCCGRGSAGVRCSKGSRGLRPVQSSAKVTGRWSNAYQGLGLAGVAAEGRQR